ncbi:hypothetical protein BS50DRAFT_217845 [Corynespora cassiicola Philippines]|uniref:Uncharacterized protein n=1 Tax=Corynespora cassiicola Philippines TaxID=1448308 RepID=A0A2T2N4W2_CORCC|nr:hypothetical protein BS50DRAFT_217845 [Corynespora cassiicola Philippines]
MPHASSWRIHAPDLLPHLDMRLLSCLHNAARATHAVHLHFSSCPLLFRRIAGLTSIAPFLAAPIFISIDRGSCIDLAPSIHFWPLGSSDYPLSHVNHTLIPAPVSVQRRAMRNC